MSSVGKVAFLKFFLNGGDPDALFQEEATSQMDRLASRTEQLVQSRVQRREALATQAKAVTDQLEAVPVLEAELNALQQANEAIAALTEVQRQLKSRVQTAQNMVHHNQRIVAPLQRQLHELRQIFADARAQPSYYENRITEFSRIMTQRMGIT
jgi:hypothetical protein